MALTQQHVVFGLGRITKTAAGANVAYTELVVEDKGINDISLIEDYKHLHHVSLAANAISDLRPLGALPDLLTIDASQNELTEALNFGGGTSNNLQRAILSNNRILELTSIAVHIHITTLMLADNQISSLAPLAALKQLRYLDVSNNQLEIVEGMCGQPLQELHLSNNKLTTLAAAGATIAELASAGIQTLKSLEVITLNDNQLMTLAPLEKCCNLTAVEAERNHLELQQVVLPLQGLNFLRHVKLTGNPLEQGLLLPSQDSKKYRNLSLPDFRRLVYRGRLLYRLLRLETLDGTIITPEEKVAAANFCGADRDAHDHCFNKHFPTNKDPPLRGRELTISRLHRPDPHEASEMLFPDVWIHRLVQRAMELDSQAVSVTSTWDVNTTIDPAEEALTLTMKDAGRVVVVLGVTNTCNLGVQKCSSSVAVVQKEDMMWRVRQIHSCYDHESHGMCSLEELQQVLNGGVFAKFFGEPPPLQGLRGNEEGQLTAGQLVAWFQEQVEAMGEKVVEQVVLQFESSLEAAGSALPQPVVTTFLESGHSKSMATLEGDLEAGTYEISARCSLSEQGALEKSSGGEPLFVWVFGDTEFSVAQVDSTPISTQQEHFSSSFNRPLSRMMTAQSRQSGSVQLESLGPTPLPLKEPACVGKYGNQESDYGGAINVRTMELFADNTCQFSHECHKATTGPTLQAEWVDGSWGVEDGCLVVEIVTNDASCVAVLQPMLDGPTRPPVGFEQDRMAGGEGDSKRQTSIASQFLGTKWFRAGKYREQYAEGIVEHVR